MTIVSKNFTVLHSRGEYSIIKMHVCVCLSVLKGFYRFKQLHFNQWLRVQFSGTGSCSCSGHTWHSQLAMGIYSTYSDQCAYTVHTAVSGHIQYSQLVVSIYSTYIYQWAYTVLIASGGHIQYSQLTVGTYSTVLITNSEHIQYSQLTGEQFDLTQSFVDLHNISETRGL